MSMTTLRAISTPRPCDSESLGDYFKRVRDRSLALCESLGPEDMTVQSMPDASPTKWHLAHVTWFFEQFLLKPLVAGYRPIDDTYHYLFNSYYYTAGEMYSRARRGLISRPTVEEILTYRRHVDVHMARLIADADPETAFLVRLGLNHEQQHQELILTDIKHVLSHNPLSPAYRPDAASCGGEAGPLAWHGFPGGATEIGFDDDDFCFDNETPRHRVWLQDFEIASRPVTNGEFLEFVRDGGYRNSELWLSDGWATIRSEAWTRPMYWLDEERNFTLAGDKPLDWHAPVAHLSYYEADAYARWAGARLPSEAEWEIAAGTAPGNGNFFESGLLHPAATPGDGPRQFFGDVWEWTASAYAPYPGFRPLAGSLGEYNGKFMCSQMVLRGGSCATPAGHLRPTYRNFFYPGQRWQFTGLRLARDV
jgi:ergothioneine biosynthesis protein EgtB